MPDLKLYHMPRACSFVTMNAMEEAGIDYDLVAINLQKGEQKSPEYLKINPSGKVPSMMVGGEVLTQNAAILIYLDSIAPEAKLLPSTTSPYVRAKGYSELIWCSSRFHPTVRMVRMPVHFTMGDQGDVRAKGVIETEAILTANNARLDGKAWWLGDQWSIVDVYVWWCTMIAASAGLSLESYPNVAAHLGRVGERDSFKRAFVRQEALQKEAGIVFPE